MHQPKVTIHVAGSRDHIGTTMLSVLIADSLNLELPHTADGESEEVRKELLALAKRGWFTSKSNTARAQFLVQKVVSLQPYTPTFQYSSIRNINPSVLGIVICGIDSAAVDAAYYRVLLLLAEIGYPNLLLSQGYLVAPIERPKVFGQVIDTSRPTERSNYTNRTAVDLTASYPSSNLPYAIIPSYSFLTAAMLGMPGSAAKSTADKFGLNYSAMFTHEQWPAKSVVVRMVTFLGQWGVLYMDTVTPSTKPLMIAFDRKHIYALMRLCNCVNGEDSPTRVTGNDPVGYLYNVFVEALNALNLTPEIN